MEGPSGSAPRLEERQVEGRGMICAVMNIPRADTYGASVHVGNVDV